jgi:capsule polysaccharide export protein KpsE/RkpR
MNEIIENNGKPKEIIYDGISKPENKIMTLYDYIKVFLENKKKIIIFTITAGLITAFIAFFIIEPVFLSTATVKTTSKTSGLTSLLGAGGLSGLGDITEIAGGSTGVSELALYENILISRRCLEETIIKFGLLDIYNYKYMQDAVKYIRENILVIGKDKVAGTLEIGIYDNSPQRAKEIADFLIFQLNKINTELNVLNARNQREFIENRYKSSQVDLKNAEDSLKSYQEIHGVAPDIVIKAATQAEMQLEIEIKSEEVKLELLRKILSIEQPEVKSQLDKISALKNQLFEMQNSNNNSSNLNLKGSPQIVMDFIRLQRNVEIQNKILTTILPLLEQAKIEEKKETPSVLILDQPNIPERKAKPKRLTIILIFSFLTFLISYITFFIKNKYKHMLKNAD